MARKDISTLKRGWSLRRGHEATSRQGKTFLTARDSAGRFVLGEGWCEPEDEETWSEGKRATLIIPCRLRGMDPNALRLRLKGRVVDGGWGMGIFLGRKLIKRVSNSFHDSRDISVSIPLGVDAWNDGGEELHVELEFENFLQGSTLLGNSDPRLLSLALRSVAIEPAVGGVADLSAVSALRTEFARRGPYIAFANTGGDPIASDRVQAIGATTRLGGELLVDCPIEIRKPLNLRLSWDRFMRAIGRPAHLKVTELFPLAKVPLASILASDGRSILLILIDDLDFAAMVPLMSMIRARNPDAKVDAVIFTENMNFLHFAFWYDPEEYQRNFHSCSFTVNGQFAYISNKTEHFGAPGYGLMHAQFDSSGPTFAFDGMSAPNAWTGPTMTLFRQLFALADVGGVAALNELTIQYDDSAHKDVNSVAYSRAPDRTPAVRLVPDLQFFNSGGYRAIREAARRDDLPRWEDRGNAVFWRGSPTTNFTALDGTPVDSLERIPRVALCLALKGVAQADAAIMVSWPSAEQRLGLSREDLTSRLDGWGIHRPMIAMIDHARYRFLIDIDGVASAWSFFEKLLLGACVLKVASPFEQWFYGEIEEWKHYVPVKRDLSDLHERLDWCLQNAEATRDIAERGQAFAMGHTLEVGREVALDAIRRSMRA
jgi:hypothetical protein